MEATYIIKDNTVKANCLRSIKIGDVVTISKKVKTRPQECYFHAIIGIIAKEQGADKDDIKDDIKLRILGFTEHNINGTIYIRPKSSKKISDDKYGKMIDAALMMANFLNIEIPVKNYYGLE